MHDQCQAIVHFKCLPLQTFEQLSLCYHFQNVGSSSIPFNSGHSLSNSQLPIPLKVRASFLYGGIAAHAGRNQMTLIYPKTQMTNNRTLLREEGFIGRWTCEQKTVFRKRAPRGGRRKASTGKPWCKTESEHLETPELTQIAYCISNTCHLGNISWGVSISGSYLLAEDGSPQGFQSQRANVKLCSWAWWCKPLITKPRVASTQLRGQAKPECDSKK